MSEIYRTKEQCIDVVNSHDASITTKYNCIRAIETSGDWKLASELWLKVGNKMNSDACLLIHQSIEEGEKIRMRKKIQESL